MALYINGQLQTMMPASSISNIRYIEEDDVVQLYYDGQWRDWKSGGMAYPVGTETTFSYKGSIDSFEIPATGVWQIDLLGAGITYKSEKKGGKTTLYEQFQSGDLLYIGVGGTCSGTTGGYNGGGNGYNHSTSTYTDYGHGGAGATHVALMSGTIRDIGVVNLDKILGIAGGAGGGANNNNSGGVGGGLTGASASSPYGTQCAGTGGSQTSAGSNATGIPSAGITVTSSTLGGFGYGGSGTSSNQAIGGGGGGLYGGGFGIYDGAAGGGSGYIKNTQSITIGTVTYSPVTTQGAGSSGNGTCIFTYLGRAS